MPIERSQIEWPHWGLWAAQVLRDAAHFAFRAKVAVELDLALQHADIEQPIRY